MRRVGLLLVLVAAGAVIWLVLGGLDGDAPASNGLPSEDASTSDTPHQPTLIGSGASAAPEEAEPNWRVGSDEIHVRVLDAVGAPVEGIPVTLLVRARISNTDLAIRANMHRPNEPVATQPSDADGRVTFSGISNNGQFRVLASPAPPLCPTERQVPGSWRGRNAVPLVELILVPGLPLSVQVVDAQGAGLAAYVDWSAAVPGRPTLPSIHSGPTATDVSGRVQFALVPPGTVGLRATAAGVGQITGVAASVPHDGDVRIVLGTTDETEIFGRVLHPDGTPVPDATLWLGTASRRPPQFRSEHQVRSGADGRYSIKQVGGDSISTFSVSAPGHASRHKIHPHRVFPRGERTELDILLPRGSTVKGTVRDVDGNPLVGAIVRALPRMEGGWGQWEAPAATTDARGAFRLEGVVPSHGSLSVQMAGFQRTGPDGPPSYSVPEPGTEQTVAIVLSRGGVIAGTVVDEAGEPVLGAIVAMGTRTGPGWFDISRQYYSRETDQAGRFRIEGFAPSGDWVLRATSIQGHSDELPLNDDTADGVLLTLRPGIALRGTIQMGGKPATTPQVVQVSLAHGLLTRKVESDEHGAFVVGGLPPGEAEVSLPSLHRSQPRQGKGTWRTRKNILLEAGKQPDPVRFELGLLGDITGRIVDADSRPIASYMVQLKPEAPSKLMPHFTRTGVDGGFRFLRLMDHLWTVHAGATEHGPVSIGQADLVVVAVRPDSDAKTPGELIRGRVLLPNGGLLAKGEFRMRNAATGAQLGSGSIHDGLFEYRLYGAIPAAVLVRVKDPRDIFGGKPNVLPDEIEVATGGAVLVVRLATGLRIAGHVLDDQGKPHDETWCQVTLAPATAPATAPGAAPNQIPPHGTVRVDEAGAFAFEGLRPGRWMLTITTNGSPYAPPAAVEAHSGDEGIDIRLQRGETIRGRVVGPTGDPMPEAQLMFQPIGADGRTSHDHRSGSSAKDGSFEIGGTSPGTIGQLSVWPPRSKREEMIKATKSDVASGSAGHVLQLSKGVYIQGRVDAAGIADMPPRFSVFARSGAGATAKGYTGKSAGLAFRIGPMEPATYELTVQLGRGFPTQKSATVTAPAKDVVIRVAKGLTAVVQVEHKNPKSVQLEWQSTRPDGRIDVSYGAPGTDGDVTFFRVDDEPGTIYARNFRTGEMALLRDVRPSAGPFRIKPSMGETIAGRIHSPKPARFRIKCVGPVLSWGSSTSDGTGTFEIKRLPPGTYDLTIEHAQGSARLEGVRTGRTDVSLTIR